MRKPTDKELINKLLVVRETELNEMYQTILYYSEKDTYTEINAKISVIKQIKHEIKKLKNVLKEIENSAKICI